MVVIVICEGGDGREVGRFLDFDGYLRVVQMGVVRVGVFRIVCLGNVLRVLLGVWMGMMGSCVV